MRLTPFVTALLFFTLLASAQQEVLVRGTLYDSEGYPLVGANVIIKGTTRRTVADLNGNYEIWAPVGSTLIVSFIGYLPEELIVGADGKAASKTAEYSAYENDKGFIHPFTAHHFELRVSETDTMIYQAIQGKAVLDDRNTFRIRNGNLPVDYSTLNKQVLRNTGSGEVLILENESSRYVYPPQISFQTTFLTLDPADLPELQNEYAQGRPVNGTSRWRGPETGEVFAWGPDLATLEYDGSDYPFHLNGRLVPAGTGTGEGANAYSPLDIFSQGSQWKNTFSVAHQFRNVKLYGKYRNNYSKGIIPTSSFHRNTLEAGGDYHRHDFKLKGNLTHSQTKGLFTGSAPFGYQFVRGILLTPPSFDNANGEQDKNNPGPVSWKLDDNTQRSSAVSYRDNPYGLVSFGTDLSASRNSAAMVNMSIGLLDQARLEISGSFNQRTHNQKYGFANPSYIFPETSSDERGEEIGEAFGKASLTWNNDHHLHGLEFQSACSFSAQTTNLDHSRIQPPALESGNAPISYSIFRKRVEQNLLFSMIYNYKDLIIIHPQMLSNRFSDLNKNKMHPGGSLGLAFRFSNLFNEWYLRSGKLRIAMGRTYRAPQLLIDPVPYSSLSLAQDALNDYYPYVEIRYANDLQPERITDLNAGLDLQLFHNSLYLSGSWFQKTTNKAFLVQQSGTDWNVKNLADLISRGLEGQLSFRRYVWNWGLRVDWTFTTDKTIVRKLYTEQPFVPLAGFGFLSKDAREGEPLGVISGSRYARDDQGRRIIGPDGFPLVDRERAIIGNPNPDWVSGLNFSVRLYEFELTATMEYRHGGEIWNGTAQSLNYYGLSAQTASERHISRFIFEGVDLAGNPNTTPVDFANPALPLHENRWVRYGTTGVGEAGIEDASSLRLSEFRISYSIPHYLTNKLWMHSIVVSFLTSNILLYTPYSGGDPETALLGNAAGTGLDYFNLPATQSWGFSLNLEF